MPDREPNSRQRATAEIDRRRQELIDAVAAHPRQTPEIAFEEHKSSAMLADFLERNGFAVERGICELPTAFRATFGSGSPRDRLRRRVRRAAGRRPRLRAQHHRHGVVARPASS